jgi:hypothetical protein
MPKPTLILDGSKYTEGTFEEGITLASFICYPPRARTASRVLGFSRKESFLKWAKQEKMEKVVKRTLTCEITHKRKASRLTDKQREQVDREALRQSKEEKGRVLGILREKGIGWSNTSKIISLAKKGVIGSSLLYRGTSFKGFCLYVVGGPYGVGYGNFKLWRCNDDVESVLGLGGCTVLYQHSWYNLFHSGSRFYIWGYAPILDLGWFKNRASSALSYTF